MCILINLQWLTKESNKVSNKVRVFSAIDLIFFAKDNLLSVNDHILSVNIVYFQPGSHVFHIFQNFENFPKMCHFLVSHCMCILISFKAHYWCFNAKQLASIKSAKFKSSTFVENHLTTGPSQTEKCFKSIQFTEGGSPLPKNEFFYHGISLPENTPYMIFEPIF